MELTLTLEYGTNPNAGTSRYTTLEIKRRQRSDNSEKANRNIWCVSDRRAVRQDLIGCSIVLIGSRTILIGGRVDWLEL